MAEKTIGKNKFGRTTTLTLKVLYTLSISTFLFSIFCYFQLNITGVIFKSLLVYSVLNSINIAIFYLHFNIINTYIVASSFGYITLLFICYFSGGINSPAISFLVLLIFFGYLIKKIYGNIWLLLVLTTVLVFYVINIISFETFNEINLQNEAEFNLLFLLFLILLLGGVFGRMMNKTNNDIKKAKLEIVKRNDEKSVMLKEIHHRVKNNLQVVNSLLRIQSRNISDTSVIDVFKSAQSRVVAMARLHENIYHTKDLKNIDIEHHFKLLITDLIKSNNINKDISLSLNIAQMDMSIDTLLPISLIINELVSNSLKHAYKDVDKGVISVKLVAINEQQCKLIVSDNGNASNKDILSNEVSSTGVTLIKTLTRQLKGSITAMSIPQGTCFEIIFYNSIS